MKINFKSLDDSNKQFKFLDGIYQLETEDKLSWIWTSTKVIGIVNNVEYITIQAFSEINNVLMYDDLSIEIKSDSLNIIKLNTKGKNDFNFSLKDTFNVPVDLRDLGIKIIGVFVDNDRIY